MTPRMHPRKRRKYVKLVLECEKIYFYIGFPCGFTEVVFFAGGNICAGDWKKDPHRGVRPLLVTVD